MFALVSDDRIWAFAIAVLAMDAACDEIHCANSITQFQMTITGCWREKKVRNNERPIPFSKKKSDKAYSHLSSHSD